MRQREPQQQPHLLGVDGFTAGVRRAQSLADARPLLSTFTKQEERKFAEIFFGRI